MEQAIAGINNVLNHINNYLWSNAVLYVVLAVGVLFTLWSGVSQFRALTHGVAVIRGKYDDKNDPGAINHFQALSTALSATVGLGNIAGVAIAISLGGPGAVFWMWVTGIVGMALKMTEVTMSMIHRDTSDPENPSGGAMWVAKRGFEKLSPSLKPVGTVLGGIFCLTLIVSTVTGGNMFQAWNVADISYTYFGVPQYVSGIIMTVVVALVIIGGIKRIGSVTGRLVPLMCGVYVLAGLYVIIVNIGRVPDMFVLIFSEAFSPTEGVGAFIGGTMGYGFLKGMQRALFSNEAGQGSSPIAHSAAKTNEPAREGLVAGLEPFVDTLVVCTITAVVILLSGTWNRDPALVFETPASIVAAKDASGAPLANTWTIESGPIKVRDELEAKGQLRDAQGVFAVLSADTNTQTGMDRHKFTGALTPLEGGAWGVRWTTLVSEKEPTLAVDGVYLDFRGATLTAKAYDRTLPGLGMWIVPATAWLFAISTMISWSYYGEQGVIFLFGRRLIMPYRLVYCSLILLACTPLIRTEHELDVISTLGTGVMLWANIPIMLIFGYQAMRTYHAYIRRLKAGELKGHAFPSITDVAEGKDVR